MTECIDIISNGRTNPKTLQKVALPVKELALPPDGDWQVGIGLNHLSASNMPLASFDQAIEPCLSPCIEKVRVLITAVSGGTKGRLPFVELALDLRHHFLTPSIVQFGKIGL